jgi:hypothetical protein
VRPLILACALAMSGCMSTGVVTMDRDVHMVHRKSDQPIFGSPDGAVADVYREAGHFCQSRGQALETVELVKERTLLLSPGSATLTFRCVAN